MRLFIAINFNETVKDELVDVIEKLKVAGIEGRFSLRENLHLTLVFIGETNDPTPIKSVMETIDETMFSLEISGLGLFKRKGGDIIWIGFKQNSKLQDIQKQLSDGLLKVGFEIEDREYSPHLTLGRQVTYKKPVDLKSIEKTLHVIKADINSVELMKSEQISGRLTYTPIHRMNLSNLRL